MSSATRAACAALPPTVTRPRTSVPNMVKKRRLAFLDLRVYVPSGADVGEPVEQVLPGHAPG